MADKLTEYKNKLLFYCKFMWDFENMLLENDKKLFCGMHTAEHNARMDALGQIIRNIEFGEIDKIVLDEESLKWLRNNELKK